MKRKKMGAYHHAHMMYTVPPQEGYFYGSPQPVYWPASNPPRWPPYPPHLPSSYFDQRAGAHYPQPPPPQPQQEPLDAAAEADAKLKLSSRAFTTLRTDLLSDLGRLVKTQVMMNKVTPFIGLRNAASAQHIIGVSPSLQTFEFHKLERSRQTPLTVMREVHRLVAFMVAQVSENIHQSYAPAMTCGLRMLRTLLRFYDTKLTDDLSSIDDEQEVHSDGPSYYAADDQTVTLREARSAIDTLSHFIKQRPTATATARGEEADLVADARRVLDEVAGRAATTPRRPGVGAA
jgi:hypothetical protein